MNTNHQALQEKINKLESELEQAHTKIAQEIHDSLAQTLASLKLRIEVLEKNLALDSHRDKINKNTHKLKQGIDLANEEIRELIKNFRAPKIESFRDSVENLATSFSSESSIYLFLQYNCGPMPFDTEIKTHIYRILQEALSNVKKHSQAKFVRITLSCDQNQLNIVIEDDGCGFLPSQNDYDADKHIGLAVMQERAQQISAKIAIESEKNEGCRIKLSMPMHPPQYNLDLDCHESISD